MHHLTRLCLDRPKATLAVLAIATSVLAVGLPQVRPEFGYRVLIGDEHPAVRRLDDFIERFGGGLPIQIGWECGERLPCRDVFGSQSMAMADAITNALGAESGVSSVLGPSNAPLLVPISGGFAVRRFMERGSLARDATDLARLATQDPLWREVLVSRDGSAAAIVIQPTDSSSATSLHVSEAVERVIAPYQRLGYRFHLTGDPIQNLIVGRDLADSTARLIPFTVLVIALILLALSRSIRATAVALVGMGVALLWSFGLLGWLGWPQDGVLEVLAPLILVVGVCDSVHLLAKHSDLLAASGDPLPTTRSDLIFEASRRVAGPCAITTLTTAAAFISFTTSDLATFFRFGAIAAFGSIACLLLTFSLLPVLMLLLPEGRARAAATGLAWQTALESILSASEKRAVPILIGSGLLLAVCAAGWSLHLRVDHEWTESLGEASQVVQSWRFMEERIGHSDTLEVEVILPDDAPLESPRTLHRLEALSRHLATIENLKEPRSILDVIKRVNQLLHENDEAHHAVPETAAANAEILELIGFDDPGLLAQWVSFDRSRVRLSVGAPEQAFSTRERVLRSVQAFASEQLPAGWRVLSTGRVAMQHAWIADVQATQLRSFPTALGLVFILIAAFFRSIRLALAALIPTILPIVVTLGAMGWSGMTLDVGRAMIAAILIGIGVDDSIHILDRYRRGRQNGDPPRDAIRAAVLHTGRAVVTTSLALALGFLTLLASAWQSIASFGFFVAIAIAGALAASLLVLPALIFTFFARQHAEEAGPWEDGSRGVLKSIGIALPVFVALGSAAFLAAEDTRLWQSPCWLLPKGHVATLPGSRSCPLQLLDKIIWVADAGGRSLAIDSGAAIREAFAEAGPVATIGIQRRGRTTTLELELERNTAWLRGTRLTTALVVAACLLVLPILLLTRSKSRAALPLGLFYAATGVILVPALGGQQSNAIDVAAILAFVVAPAALAQLGMVFPTESRMVRIAPRLQLLPYAASAILAVIALLALDRSPLLWPTFVYLLLALYGAAWLVLLASCAFAAREASSGWNRTRARFVLIVSLFLPAVVAAPLGWNGSAAEVAVTYLGASTLVIPLPIGLAISRYNLFDLGWHTRRAAARIVYFASGAFGLSVVVQLAGRVIGVPAPPDFGPTFATALVCLMAAEALRQPIVGLLDTAFSPRAEELRSLRDSCTAEMSSLEAEDAIARRLLAAVRQGLRVEAGWLALRHGNDWEVVMPRGEAEAPALSIFQQAAPLIEHRPIVQIHPEISSPLADRLLASEISVVVALRHGDEMLGVLLLGDGRARAPHAGFELDFVAALASQAAIGIHVSRLADERAAVERDATTARVAVDLMHELGKDLGWMRGLASRLAQRASSQPKLRQGAAQVDALAEDLVRRMQSFVEDATSRTTEPPGLARLDELLESSLRDLHKRYGPDRIRLSHDPSLRSLRCHEQVGRALTHSLQQAMGQALGDSGSAPICIRARIEDDGQLLISLVDSAGQGRAELQIPISSPGRLE